MADCSSGRPPLGVYLWFLGSRQASTAASTMWAGVGKSGSPAPKPITFSPCALSALALASTAKVADGAIAASRSDTRFTGPHAARRAVDFLSVFREHSGAGRLSAGRPGILAR